VFGILADGRKEASGTAAPFSKSDITLSALIFWSKDRFDLWKRNEEKEELKKKKRGEEKGIEKNEGKGEDMGKDGGKGLVNS
jgi:hypothetical protein